MVSCKSCYDALGGESLVPVGSYGHCKLGYHPGCFEYEADDDGLLGMVWKGIVAYRLLFFIISDQYYFVN